MIGIGVLSDNEWLEFFYCQVYQEGLPSSVRMIILTYFSHTLPWSFITSDVYHIDGYDELYTHVVTVSHISDGLQRLHMLMLPYNVWCLFIFLDVCPYFISVLTSTCVITLYLLIPDIIVSCILSLMTISTYNFFFPISFSFSFCPTKNCPYFKHTPWFRVVPYVTYLYISTPLLCHGTSPINIIKNIL